MATSPDGAVVQVVHRGSERDRSVLADEVRLADGFVARTRGLIGRPALTDGEAVVFRFRSPARRRVHTLFVNEAIDVVWIEAERANAVHTLDAWSLGAAARADTVIELPAGAAEAVAPGELVQLAGDAT